MSKTIEMVTPISCALEPQPKRLGRMRASSRCSCKELREILASYRIYLRQLQVFLDVLNSTHSNQRCCNPRRRTYELNSCLRISGERPERISHIVWQIGSNSTLHHRRACHHSYAKLFSRLQDSYLLSTQHLIQQRQCFRHAQVEWQLNKAKTVIVSCEPLR